MNTLTFFERLKTIAINGLNYCQNIYDQQRYEELLNLSSTQYADLLEIDKNLIKKQFAKEIGQLTPKVGVNGIIYNAEKKLLLELRSDDNSWGIIGGWAEPGETPEQSLKREFIEEANLNIEITSSPVIFSRTPGNNYPFTSVHLVYECRIISGEIKCSHESEKIEFCNPQSIKSWHRDHQTWINFITENGFPVFVNSNRQSKKLKI